MGQIQISVFVMQPTWIPHLQGKIAALNSLQRQKGPRAGTETSGTEQTSQRSFVMYTACYGGELLKWLRCKLVVSVQ